MRIDQREAIAKTLNQVLGTHLPDYNHFIEAIAAAADLVREPKGYGAWVLKPERRAEDRTMTDAEICGIDARLCRLERQITSLRDIDGYRVNPDHD